MNGFAVPAGADLAQAVSEACAFAATVPLPGRGVLLRFARGALAVVLVPVLLNGEPHGSSAALESALCGATIGAALGLAATIAFSAAATAGALAGAALAWSPLPSRDMDAEPIGSLFQLGFTAVLLASGGFTKVIALVAQANAASATAFFTVGSVAGLAAIALRESLWLAAPALFAQALASLMAGIAARAAPQIGSLLLASPLVSSAVGAVLLAGGGLLLSRFGWIASESLAGLAHH